MQTSNVKFYFCLVPKVLARRDTTVRSAIYIPVEDQLIVRVVTIQLDTMIINRFRLVYVNLTVTISLLHSVPA